MGYTANRTIQSLYPSEPLERAVRRIAEGTGELLHDGAVRRTPVAEVPEGHTMGKFVSRRKGRKPGTLKRAWRTGPVGQTVTPSGVARFIVEEFNDDEVWPHVEYDTRPHTIPTGGAAAGKTLVWLAPGGITRMARSVRHPGTTGVHMTREAIAEAEVTWERRVGEPELDRWAREMEALPVSALSNLRRAA